MNAQSTPVRKKNLKIRLTDSFPETVTPIRNCTTFYNEFLDVNSSLPASQKQDHLMVALTNSQRKRHKKRKKKEENRKLNKKLFSCDSGKIKNSSTIKSDKSSNKDSGNYSNEFVDNFCSEIKDFFDDTFDENSGSVHTEEQLLESKLSKSPNTNNSNSKKLSMHTILRNTDSKSGVQKLNQNFTKEEFMGEKLNEILSVSDVMNWNDESLMPKTSNMNLTDQIKRKLLENAKNKEVVNSQTSGWTQLNSSMVLKADKCIQYQEFGPFYGLPLKVQQLYEEDKGIKKLYCEFFLMGIMMKMYLASNISICKCMLKIIKKITLNYISQILIFF